MKWRTIIVACLILCSSGFQGSNGTLEASSCTKLDTNVLPGSAVTVAQGGGLDYSNTPMATLLNTLLCSSSTLNTLTAPTLVAILNALSETPQLYDALPPATIIALLTAVSSSSNVIDKLPPNAVLVLLAAASKSAPTLMSTLPSSKMLPLLKSLSGSSSPSTTDWSQTVLAKIPPLPPSPPQIVVPAPAPGPMYISLPSKSDKPPPIVIPTGPPPSIVVSIPRNIQPPPLILPNGTPGPIVIGEEPNCAKPSPPIILPAPAAPNIYFTTHLAKSCSNNILDPVTGTIRPNNYYDYHTLPEMPKVYALPPGVSPSEYFRFPKTC